MSDDGFVDDSFKRIVRDAHTAGALDVLRRVLDQFALEPDHRCMARSYCERLYRDPNSFQHFIKDTQRAREQ